MNASEPLLNLIDTLVRLRLIEHTQFNSMDSDSISQLQILFITGNRHDMFYTIVKKYEDGARQMRTN